MLTRPTYAVNNIQTLADITKDQATAVKVLHDKTGADNKEYLEDVLLPELDAKFSIPEGGAAAMAVAAYNKVNNGFISVTEPPYNAKGDGITDDTTAIQNAANVAGGKTLFFPHISGTAQTIYMVSTAIWIKSKTKVLCDKGVVIKRIANTVINAAAQDENNVFCIGSSAGVRYTNIEPAEWVEFVNVEVDGNCQNQSSFVGSVDFSQGGWGIVLNYTESAVLRDCHIHHCFAGGIRTKFSIGTILDNVECSYNAVQTNFGGTGNGFDLNGNSDTTDLPYRRHVLLTNCKSHHNADNGFVTINCSDVSFANCHAWENGISEYSTNSALGFEFGGDRPAVPFPSNLQFSNCSSRNNVRFNSSSNNNSGLRGTILGDAVNLQISNFLSIGHTGNGIDIDYYDGSTGGSIQLNNILIDGYGDTGKSGPGLLLNIMSNIKNVVLSNVEVNDGLGTSAGISILANATNSKVNNLYLSNVVVSNCLSDGLFANGNIDNFVMNGVNAINNSLNGIKISAGTGFVMNNISLVGCQCINNNTSAGANEGIAFYPNAGKINKVSISGCISSRNRYGITITAMVKKCFIDEGCILTDNTSGALNNGGTASNYLTAIPAIGTWNLGEYIHNRQPAASGYSGWICITAGTFGTLTGVTGSITTGTSVLTVNDVTNLEVGMYITIAGVTGVKRILSISGLVVTIDANADATVTNAAVAYNTPVFKGFGTIQA